MIDFHGLLAFLRGADSYRAAPSDGRRSAHRHNGFFTKAYGGEMRRKQRRFHARLRKLRRAA